MEILPWTVDPVETQIEVSFTMEGNKGIDSQLAIFPMKIECIFKTRIRTVWNNNKSETMLNITMKIWAIRNYGSVTSSSQ